jgi:hypothetical protein
MSLNTSFEKAFRVPTLHNFVTFAVQERKKHKKYQQLNLKVLKKNNISSMSNVILWGATPCDSCRN